MDPAQSCPKFINFDLKSSYPAPFAAMGVRFAFLSDDFAIFPGLFTRPRVGSPDEKWPPPASISHACINHIKLAQKQPNYGCRK
jgi:hypothetical protein